MFWTWLRTVLGVMNSAAAIRASGSPRPSSSRISSSRGGETLVGRGEEAGD
jgi:hypothetical protein